MARITILPGMSNLDDWESLRRFTSMAVEAITTEVNGRLTFGGNIDASGPHSVTFASASDVQAVAHNLGRIPTGFIVVNLNAGIVVYQPSVPAWLKDQIFLQASGAGTATIYVV